MSKEKLGNSPAFPTDYGYQQDIGTVPDSGMSKRFYAACAAMQSVIQSAMTTPDTLKALNEMSVLENKDIPEMIVKMSYEYADELLKQENL